jgi:hypothetical protein
MFLNKIWPNDDLRVGWTSPSNLVKFIEPNAHLEGKFEGYFEWYEVVKIW